MLESRGNGMPLPNGELFQAWEDRTVYARTLYVNQAHLEASDENPGTEEEPFLTINRAAREAGPGDKVVVKPGVYRECVTPARGGTGPDAMVCYEAARGAKAAIRGSRVLPRAWTRSRDPQGQDYSFRLWQIGLPEVITAAEENPFALVNASDDEIDLMPWALRWKGRVPYTLPRGLIFQDGVRLTQLALYEDLVRLPGSYWVDRDEQVLHVHPLDEADPNAVCFEATAQAHLFKPQSVGLDYVRVSGFVFEHAGNGFARIGVGAVYVNGGQHWIIQENVVRHCNSVGIEAGARIGEVRACSAAENERVEAHQGGFVVRRNTVYDCGTGGIEGHTVRNSRVAENHIFQIGWQDVERYWECAAIKTLRNVNCLFRRNVIHDVVSACGIWLDWDNRNCRVTQNVLYDVRQSHHGGIFVEASKAPNWIDHNLIWDVWQNGVCLFDTDQVRVCHNLIAHTDIPVASRVNTDRSLHGAPMSSQRNVIRNNVLYGNAAPPAIQSAENECDDNVYSDEPALDLAGRANPRWDEGSTVLSMSISLDGDALELGIDAEQPFPVVPRDETSDLDFWSRAVAGTSVRPGPFAEWLAGGASFRLAVERSRGGLGSGEEAAKPLFVGERPFRPLNVWARIANPVMPGEFLAFTYEDPAAGFSAKGAPIQGALTVQLAARAAQAPSATIRLSANPAMRVRPLSPVEIADLGLPAEPAWLSVYGPQGNEGRPWRADPRLMGLFHPQYLNDVPVCFCLSARELAEIMWVRLDGVAADGEGYTGTLLNAPSAASELDNGSRVIVRMVSGLSMPVGYDPASEKNWRRIKRLARRLCGKAPPARL